MDAWKLPWDGGCRCGETRLRVTGAPLLTSACHCAGCRSMTASAFSLTLTVPAEGFAVTAGAPVVGAPRGPSRHFYCPACMTWMFTRPEGLDAFVNLRPSTLDAHGWFIPFIEVNTREKLPWASTLAKYSYPTEPDFDAYGG